MPNVRRALISVSDKTGVVQLGKALAALGVEILSTGGTAKTLRDAGVTVTEVSDYTGSPEILEGRLKTLHPKIHGGILGIRKNPQHGQEMKSQGIAPIDLVVVNLYPFEATVAKKECTLEEAIEHVDIGGPTMVRAAAKNYRDVAVVVDPADYASVLRELQETKALSVETTFTLAQKAFAHTAKYDAAIANYLNPKIFCMVFEGGRELRYGENPHQKASFYRDTSPSDEPSLVTAKQLQGKELSYNNILDTDGALNMIKELREASFSCAIIKHANPCGVAISSVSLADAFQKARACDPTSAFGGIVAFNREGDEHVATLLSETFFEVIAAPCFHQQAREILKKKKNLRLLEAAGLGKSFHPSGITLRKVAAGLLVQDRDLSQEAVRDGKIATTREPTKEEWRGLEFSWRVCKHVKSNAIVIATSEQTLGIGAGQMSRVDAVHLAIKKMNDCTIARSHDCTILASDAFFPFRDGIDAAAKAGITAIVQPGGSLRDDEVIAAANEHNIAMVFTGTRHFSH